ncbi:hypothetical protein Tco_0534362 [Tanacetum coccineum]
MPKRIHYNDLIYGQEERRIDAPLKNSTLDLSSRAMVKRAACVTIRTVLNDYSISLYLLSLKRVRERMPETFWSQRDKANARAMIQAIDKKLKTRRIMRSLERFIGGRPYGGRSDNEKHAEYDESNTYVLERFNTSAGNPVKKILLQLNLLITVNPSRIRRLFKDGGGGPDSSWLTRSITTCS